MYNVESMCQNDSPLLTHTHRVTVNISTTSAWVTTNKHSTQNRYQELIRGWDVAQEVISRRHRHLLSMRSAITSALGVEKCLT